MKPLPQELKRIHQLSLVHTKVSPDTKAEVTRKDLEHFTKEVQTTLRTKRKNLVLVCLEVEKGEDQ